MVPILVMLLDWCGYNFAGFCLVLISMILLDWCEFDVAGFCLVPISVILLDWHGSNFAWFCWSFVGFFGWRWVIGSETRVVCLSFGSLFGFVHGGGGNSKWF